MYSIYADDDLLHYPLLDADGKIVINPVLQEKLNTHGSLQFQIAPTNPLYDKLEPRKTKIKVLSDTRNDKPWFGRVMSVDRGWNNLINVYCEGEFGCLCDSLVRPYAFKGDPAVLLADLVTNYNGSRTDGYTLQVGNVSVTDPNNYIVRSSNTANSVWDVMRESLFESSLGGYLLPRYDKVNDIHYIDYLALDADDQYAVVSEQEIEFGKNLLNFSQSRSAVDVFTVLIPFGASLPDDDPDYADGPPESHGHLINWNGNRLTITDVNNGRNYIENAAGIAMWGRIVGTHTWDNVTIAQNLLNKATAYLAQQIWESVNIEVSAVDLAFVNADVNQIQVGEYVRCKSKPHDLNVLLLCTQKTTYLTQLEKSSIILGAGQKTITDLQAQSQMKEANN